MCVLNVSVQVCECVRVCVSMCVSVLECSYVCVSVNVCVGMSVVCFETGCVSDWLSMCECV